MNLVCTSLQFLGIFLLTFLLPRVAVLVSVTEHVDMCQVFHKLVYQARFTVECASEVVESDKSILIAFLRALQLASRLFLV